jgi:PAS domain-containing protein
VHVQRRRQKNLVLILAREFAANLATPMFVTDSQGLLVYYNEPAEILLGRSFAEAGELAAEEWTRIFKIAGPDGSPMPIKEMPGGIALLERREAHKTLKITSFDGVERALEVTAFPLLDREDRPAGCVILFWEPG